MSAKQFDLQTWLATTERELLWAGKRIRAVIVRRHFEAPIEKVWQAWVDGWKTRVVEGEPSPGHTVLLDLGQPQRTAAKILACEPPKHLLTTWTYGRPDPAPSQPDEVEVRIAKYERGCLLELEHRSENGSSWAPGVGAGWEAGLLMFDVRLGGGDPASVPVAVAFPKLDEFWTEFVKKHEPA
jgi:uncharacterized protein YndB with AHSA1/START domain